MRFSVSDDVALPRDRVFETLSDFDLLAQRAGKLGQRIDRVDPPGPISIGSCWNTDVKFHGLKRPATVRVSELRPPEGFVLAGQSEGVAVTVELSLAALDGDTTRLRLVTDIHPRNLTGRMLVRTAKLMKSTLEGRYKDRVRAFLRRIENEAR